MNSKLYIFGYSGHAYVVLDAAASMKINLAGYFDHQVAKQNPYQLTYLGDERTYDFSVIDSQAIFFPAMGNNLIRERIMLFAKNKFLPIVSIIHAETCISKHAEIGSGTLVSAGAIVNSMAVIGEGAIINTGAIIEHECHVGNFSHIAPGTVLAGNVHVGNQCFIGANAVIKEGISIGNHVTVGAGAVVLNDINDGETWVGNPAKRIK